MHRFDISRRVLAFAIAGLAGFVDATGFLAAEGYFVSFMSGNTTRLGVILATEPWRAVTPLALIGTFVIGVMLGAVTADLAGERNKSRIAMLGTLLLAAAALSYQAQWAVGFLGFTVLAMGALNNTFRRSGEVVVGLTYMTGALVRFGQGLAARMRGQSLPGWLANGALWASLALGAVAGAAAYSYLPAYSGWISLILSACVVVLALKAERRPISG